jgi:hypothetical protein
MVAFATMDKTKPASKELKKIIVQLNKWTYENSNNYFDDDGICCLELFCR